MYYTPGQMIFIAEQRVEELRREAAHDRMVSEALRYQREQEIALGIPPHWQRVPAEIASRALQGIGKRLLGAGEWLRCFANPRSSRCVTFG